MVEQNFLNHRINDAEKHLNILPTCTNISDDAFHVGAICLILFRGDAFFRDLFFGTSGEGGVPPWSDFWLPWGTIASIL